MIGKRKSEHIEIVLKGDVRSRTETGLDCVRFAHVALPELALSDVDTSCTFLSRQMRAPIIVSSMTGGPKRSESINVSYCNSLRAQRHWLWRRVSAHCSARGRRFWV